MPVSAFVFVEKNLDAHVGINPNFVLELYTYGKVTWRAHQLKGDLYAHERESLVAENPDSPFMLTDALALHCTEILPQRKKIDSIIWPVRKLRQTEAYKDVPPSDDWFLASLMWDLSKNAEHLALFEQTRPLVEQHPIPAKLVVVLLKGCNSAPILANLKKLKVEVELCTSMPHLGE